MLCEKTSNEIKRCGFHIKKNLLTLAEVKTLQSMILDNINHIFIDNNMPVMNNWNELLSQYEKIDNNVHLLVSSKNKRLLTKNQTEELEKLKFFNHLNEMLGKFIVTDEEAFGYPEMYWRIVRPNEHSDIGPMHADGWFWDLNESWRADFYKNRLKVWIPIETESGKNGLKVIKGSHQNQFKYTISCLNGKKKPIIKSILQEEKISLLDMNATDLIVFHDRLLHGGALNKGCTVRVSLEFTCSITDEKI